MNKQLSLFPELDSQKVDAYVPFVSEVEQFNETFGKPNNYVPNIPEKKDWQFVYDFILEELEEYKAACEAGDIVEVLDALCDIAYVSLGNGTMLHGLKDKIWPAYLEVQGSNMSKACSSEEEDKKLWNLEQLSKRNRVTTKGLEMLMLSIEHVIKK